jgi:glycosyltransferase involved in cell wall biosynthesis
MQLKNIVIFTTQKNTIRLSELQTKGCSGTVYSYLLLAREFVNHGNKVIIINSKDDCTENGILYKSISSKIKIVNYINSFSSEIDVIIGVSYSSELFKDINCENALKIFWWHNVYTSNFFDIIKLVGLGKIDKMIGVGSFQLGPNLGHLIRESFKYKINIFKRISIISNQVDSLFFPIYSFLSNKENKIAYIGNPGKQQGFHLTVKVYSELKKKYPDLKLGVFGGGALHSSRDLIDKDYYNEYLADFLKEESFNDGIFYYGVLNRDELYKELKTYKLSLLGLYGLESFCIAACESCGCGVPVVSRITGGQASFLKVNGFLGKSFDEVVTFVDQILRMENEERKLMELKYLNLNKNFSPILVYNKWMIEIQKGKSTKLFHTFNILFLAAKERLITLLDKFE